MRVHNKLYHLIQLGEYLNSTQYREVEASIIAKALVEKIQERD
ncbi:MULTISPECIES: hypothetical protein [Bacillus cereus group]|nr:MULTISPECIES: hypothetical protein [Bacillus cereus group]WJX08193.1 hypothetical protein QTA68_30380 [Bacillus cereus]